LFDFDVYGYYSMKETIEFSGIRKVPFTKLLDKVTSQSFRWMKVNNINVPYQGFKDVCGLGRVNVVSISIVTDVVLQIAVVAV